MKKPNNISGVSLLICLFLSVGIVWAQEEEKPSLILNLSHYTTNNSLQYLKVQTQIRADNKIQPVKDVSVQLYIDSIAQTNFIGHIKTNEKGTAETTIPYSLKDVWGSSSVHKFIAVTKDEQTITELEIVRARMEIDTLNEDGARSVVARVFSLENGEWIPAKDVDVTIGVKRLGGSIKIGDEESYTTDSSGQVTAEFKLDSLPASDVKGNIILTAKLDQNEQFGNLSIEKTVPWGKYYKHSSSFGERSLWAARFRSPLWLLFMAYSIVAGVWGVIIYLVIQIFKMKRLGNRQSTIKEKTFHAREIVT